MFGTLSIYLWCDNFKKIMFISVLSLFNISLSSLLRQDVRYDNSFEFSFGHCNYNILSKIVRFSSPYFRDKSFGCYSLTTQQVRTYMLDGL